MIKCILNDTVERRGESVDERDSGSVVSHSESSIEKDSSSLTPSSGALVHELVKDAKGPFCVCRSQILTFDFETFYIKIIKVFGFPL